MERSLFITSLLASSLCVRPGGISLGSGLGSTSGPAPPSTPAPTAL